MHAINLESTKNNTADMNQCFYIKRKMEIDIKDQLKNKRVNNSKKIIHLMKMSCPS